jgi:hypothetical protein
MDDRHSTFSLPANSEAQNKHLSGDCKIRIGDMPVPNLFAWIILAIFCLLTTMFLYEAWVNLVSQKFSRFSLDALLVHIFQRVGIKKTKENIKAFPRNKAEIIVLGMSALVAGLKGIQEIIN